MKRCLGTPLLVMRKNPHRVQARQREEREDGLKGWETSKTGSSMQALGSGIILSLPMKMGYFVK